MSDQIPVCKPLYSLLPADVEGFNCLTELALDMRWSWNHATDEVWRQLDPVLWELTHHPWDVLQTVSREKVIAQAPARQVVYIENTPIFVRIAEGSGIRSILHADYRSTCAKLASLGLRNEEGGDA